MPDRSNDHSDGLSAHSLPSLTTYAMIVDTRCISASLGRAILLLSAYDDGRPGSVTRITKVANTAEKDLKGAHYGAPCSLNRSGLRRFLHWQIFHVGIASM